MSRDAKGLTGAYLITGATGDIGSRVVKRLVARGERPRVLVRKAAKALELFGDRVETHIGDLGDPLDLAKAFVGTDVCFLVNAGREIPERDSIAA
jgi:uncharacterized protein YbjT (DUF2867 family)